MKGNILSLYFRQPSTLCVGGKNKDSFEDFTEFQVYAKKYKNELEIKNGIYRMVSVSLSFSWLLVW